MHIADGDIKNNNRELRDMYSKTKPLGWEVHKTQRSGIWIKEHCFYVDDKVRNREVIQEFTTPFFLSVFC